LSLSFSNERGISLLLNVAASRRPASMFSQRPVIWSPVLQSHIAVEALDIVAFSYISSSLQMKPDSLR